MQVRLWSQGRAYKWSQLYTHSIWTLQLKQSVYSNLQLTWAVVCICSEQWNSGVGRGWGSCEPAEEISQECP